MTVDARRRGTAHAGGTLLDPRNAYPRPPFPAQRQKLPGRDFLMDPEAGPRRGLGMSATACSEGLATIVTGSDSGIGKAVALAFAREGRTWSSRTSRCTTMRA